MAVIQLQVIGDHPQAETSSSGSSSQPTGAAMGTGSADVTIMNDD